MGEMAFIGPSLMCANFGKLQENIEQLELGGVDYYHFDIMDGNFVPNFTMGPDMVKSLRGYTKKPFDVHMMVEAPERYIELFASAGADMISIHAETKAHLQRGLQQIRNLGLKAGVALNPSTPLAVLEYVLDVTDYVCLMTVNPGFAGQKFIPSMYQKISDLKTLIDRRKVDVKIQVDGNISYDTIPKVLERGADMLVCGTSSLFYGSDLEKNTIALKQFIAGEQKRLSMELPG
ncbi:ribulose-phosphate 3-epimerase [Paenibacillus faecis]|nr:ribulose-phosphate 3-epimerase [Paenibacillus faecis]